MSESRVIGKCRHCGSEYLLDPDWEEPIWANCYYSDPRGHQVGTVTDPKIINQGRSFEDEKEPV